MSKYADYGPTSCFGKLSNKISNTVFFKVNRNDVCSKHHPSHWWLDG